MANSWKTKDVQWPDLERLNGGQEFTATSLTYELLNAIVYALMYLYSREVT